LTAQSSRERKKRVKEKSIDVQEKEEKPLLKAEKRE